MTDKKILLIENQFTQFDTLQRELSVEYIVFPEQLPTQPENVISFKAFIDPIRVILNPRYKRNQGPKAFKELMAYIEKKQPDLLVVDYILVSHSAANNGADLAKKIREALPPGNIMPVLFISRTPRDRIDVIKSIESMKYKDWADKQYYAGTLLDSVYVKEVLIPKINALFEEIKEEKEREKRTEINVHLEQILVMTKFVNAMKVLGINRDVLLDNFKKLSEVPQEALEKIEHQYEWDDFETEKDEIDFINYLQKLNS